MSRNQCYFNLKCIELMENNHKDQARQRYHGCMTTRITVTIGFMILPSPI